MADSKLDIEYRITANWKAAINEAKKLDSSIDANTNSIKTLKDAHKSLLTQFQKTEIGTKEWEQLGGKLAVVEEQLEKTTLKYKNLANATQLSNTAVSSSGRLAQQTRLLNNELAFVIQDGAFAFQDLRLGVLGVSNNLPRLAIRMKEVKLATGSWWQAIKTTAAGLLSFNGIASLATGALVAWSVLSSRAKKETSELEEKVNDLEQAFSRFLKLESPLEKFTFPLKDVDITKALRSLEVNRGKLIQDIFSDISRSGITDLQFGGNFQLSRGTEIEFDRSIAKLKELIEFARDVNFEQRFLSQSPIRTKEQADSIENIINKYEDERKVLDAATNSIKDKEDAIKAQQTAFEALKNAGLEPVNKEIKDLTKNINEGAFSKALLDNFVNLRQVMQKTIELSRELSEVQPTITRPELSEITVSPFGLPEIPPLTEQEINELFPIETTLVNAFEKTIANAGIQAFEAIFGEANSLLEQFIANVVDNFAAIAAQDIAGGLLNLATGGTAGTASGILGFIGDLFNPSSAGRALGQNQGRTFTIRNENNFVVDGAVFSQQVTEREIPVMLDRISGRRGK